MPITGLPASLAQIKFSEAEGFALLGGPVGAPEFRRATVAERADKLKETLTALSDVQNSQVEYHLLRSCLGAAKFSYVTRTCDPAVCQGEFQNFDIAQCEALQDILGAPLAFGSKEWILASLPVSQGGLGIRPAADHSSAAFIASLAQTKSIVQELLGGPTAPTRKCDVALEIFKTASAGCVNTVLPDEILSCDSQKLLSRAIDEVRERRLLDMPMEPRFRALVHSVKLQGTGAFLNAIPSPALGLRMSSEEFTVSLKMRLGMSVFSADGRCNAGKCKLTSDALGDHALGRCQGNGFKIWRHDMMRNSLFQVAQAACLAPRKEERGHIKDSAARPGDITLRHWSLSGGKPKTCFDITVVSPMTDKNLIDTANGNAKCTGDRARERKIKYYKNLNLPSDIDLIPLPVTTFGAWEPQALVHIKELCKMQARTTGKDKHVLTRQVLQKLSVNLQREIADELFARRPILPAHVDGEI